jgi:hypothetical protein
MAAASAAIQSLSIRALSKAPGYSPICTGLPFEQTGGNFAANLEALSSAPSRGRRPLQRESVLFSLPGSSTSGVGSKPGGDIGTLATVSCETLIVSRFTAIC